MIAVMDNIDFTWAILLQMKGELTREEVLGILETHKLNFEDSNTYKLPLSI
jgi:hypothetical protein